MLGPKHETARKQNRAGAHLADQVGAVVEPLHGDRGRGFKIIEGVDEKPAVEQHPGLRMARFQLAPHAVIGGNVGVESGHDQLPFNRWRITLPRFASGRVVISPYPTSFFTSWSRRAGVTPSTSAR